MIQFLIVAQDDLFLHVTFWITGSSRSFVGEYGDRGGV